MEPHDNRQLGLQKAISSHEQAAATLSDLMDGAAGGIFAEMLERIEQNIRDLQRVAASSRPGDLV